MVQHEAGVPCGFHDNGAAGDVATAPEIVAKQFFRQVRAGRASQGQAVPMVLETAAPTNLLWPAHQEFPRFEHGLHCTGDVRSALRALGQEPDTFLVEPEAAQLLLKEKDSVGAVKAIGFLVGNAPVVVVLQAGSRASVKAISVQLGQWYA